MKPVREVWWDTCVKKLVVPCYSSRQGALSSKESEKKGRVSGKGVAFNFIWGDRVRVISGNYRSDPVVQVDGRGRKAWIRSKHLGGKPLLELYVIDVGQGDGLLLVTPEGHHLLIDGGDLRSRQVTKKNAADFVDWKFYSDYLGSSDRKHPEKATIRLDAMIASHNDQDHFGGLFDLLNRQTPKNVEELRCDDVLVENFYHAGLSWWAKKNKSKDKYSDRTLGPVKSGFRTKLIGDRASAEKAVARIKSPDANTLSGNWGKFIATVVASRKSTNPGSPTHIERLSSLEHKWLPGFAPKEQGSRVSIRVLGPVAEKNAGKVGLKKFPSSDSINTNGHSVVLRVDYGNRKLLLTGDLNTASQEYIMKAYGKSFRGEFGCDVAKGCHHGSHDVSFPFLAGLEPLATVISSGDAETHDHPRPAIVAASAITGRKLLSADGRKLVAPLVYMTEIARSYTLGGIVQLHHYKSVQPIVPANNSAGDKAVYKSASQMKRFRAAMKSSPKYPADWPRLDQARTVKGIVYGLVNVRTDGKKLFFATMEEKGKDWAIEVLTEAQINAATSPF